MLGGSVSTEVFLVLLSERVVWSARESVTIPAACVIDPRFPFSCSLNKTRQALQNYCVPLDRTSTIGKPTTHDVCKSSSLLSTPAPDRVPRRLHAALTLHRHSLLRNAPLDRQKSLCQTHDQRRQVDEQLRITVGHAFRKADSCVTKAMVTVRMPWELEVSRCSRETQS